ncbi:hypothetical protein J437_LFUL018581 [Ladona fulva]|uniref:Uncharacterized protein n=1 Tax=Ladona fulva TaxID=123851 RepID=A0A8K0KS30_LADFU|nr:hypothetical protein J437_LFUL018581 [Ladona fulva]
MGQKRMQTWLVSWGGEMRTWKLSYEVMISGQIRWKHIDQLHSRSGVTDDKPTPTMANQEQEVEFNFLTDEFYLFCTPCYQTDQHVGKKGGIRGSARGMHGWLVEGGRTGSKGRNGC